MSSTTGRCVDCGRSASETAFHIGEERCDECRRPAPVGSTVRSRTMSKGRFDCEFCGLATSPADRVTVTFGRTQVAGFNFCPSCVAEWLGDTRPDAASRGVAAIIADLATGAISDAITT